MEDHKYARWGVDWKHRKLKNYLRYRYRYKGGEGALLIWSIMSFAFGKEANEKKQFSHLTHLTRKQDIGSWVQNFICGRAPYQTPWRPRL